jgi:hypothetical protein
MPQHTTTTGLAEDSVVRVRHRTHFHRVLADAYIHELGESDSQVGVPLEPRAPLDTEARISCRRARGEMVYFARLG